MTAISDEQRTAYERFKKGDASWDVFEALTDLLPVDLTNPLPEDPGYYLSMDKIFMLRHTGEWFEFGDLKNALKPDYVRTWMPLQLLAVKRDEPEDERISAWNKIASHPLFKDDYDTEGTLIDAMIAHLDRLVEKSPVRVVRESRRAEFIQVGDKIQGDVVTDITPVKSTDLLLFEFGGDRVAFASDKDSFIENWESGF